MKDWVFPPLMLLVSFSVIREIAQTIQIPGKLFIFILFIGIAP